jgi:hypothetical protein
MSSNPFAIHQMIILQWKSVPSFWRRWSLYFIYGNVILALITLPIDAFIGLFPSTYRPLSIVFLMFAFIVQFTRLIDELKLNTIIFIIKRYGFLIVFILFSLIVSYYRTVQFDLPLGGFVNSLLTFAIGSMTFISFDLFFRLLKEYNIEFELWISSLFTFVAWIYTPLVLWGFVEVFIFFRLLPLELKQGIVQFFARKSYIRVQWLSGEPSWAAMQILFSIPFLAYQSILNHRYKLIVWLAVILLILSFSIQGLFSMIIAGCLAVIFLRPKWIVKIVLLLIGVLILSLVVYYMASILFPSMYFLNRIQKAMNVASLGDLIYVDGSVAIRILYPYSALILAKIYPWIGVGVGNFRYFFPSVVKFRLPRLHRYQEVKSNISRLNANPKNLYTRLIGETGLIGSFMFTWFIVDCVKPAFKSRSQHREWVILIMIVVFSNMLQFDSFAYVPLWLVLAIAKQFPQKNDLSF